MKRSSRAGKRAAIALATAALALALFGMGLGGLFAGGDEGASAGTSSGGGSAQTRNGESELQQASVVRVVDGDTLIVDIDGEQSRVRLIGIDAPESVHPDTSKNTEEGASASEHVKAILPAGTTVWLEEDTSDTDKYGRLLRYVWLEEPDDPDSESEFAGKTLNAQLVAEGWAAAKRYEPDVKWADALESLEDG